jgi:hypothetical protein
MNHFTITSTLNKEQLPKFLAEIKSMLDEEYDAAGHDLHIKTIHSGKDDKLCTVTINRMLIRPTIH